MIPVSTERHVGWDRHGTNFRRSNLFQKEKIQGFKCDPPQQQQQQQQATSQLSLVYIVVVMVMYKSTTPMLGTAWEKNYHIVAELTLHRLHRPGGRVCCSRSGHHDRLLERSITIGRAPSRKTAQKRKRKRRKNRSQKKVQTQKSVVLYDCCNHRIKTFFLIQQSAGKKTRKKWKHFYIFIMT